MKPFNTTLPSKVLLVVVGVTLILSGSNDYGAEGTLLKVISLSEGDPDDPVFTTSCKWNRELILKSPGDLEGLLVHSTPKDACTKIGPPPEPPSSNGSYPIEPDWILVATWSSNDRCTLLTKATLAEKAGYSAVVIQLGEDDNDDADDSLSSWTGSTAGGEYWDYSLSIYPCLVTYEDGQRLWNNYTSDEYLIRFEDQSVDTWTKLFITTFLALIAILLAIALSYCVVQMFILLVVWVRDTVHQIIETRRLNRRRRLPSSQLKRIPTQQWSSDMVPQDMCTICLENYTEVDRVRILPCSHVFHVACIDPWLLNQRRKCPNCKRKIVFPDEPYDSDSSTEDERTPLIRREGSLDHSIAGGLTFTFNESDFANQQQPIYRAIHRMMLESNARQRAALEQRLRNQHLSRTSQGQGSSSTSPDGTTTAAGSNATVLQHAIRHHRLSRFCPRKRLPRSLFGGNNNNHPEQGEPSGESGGNCSTNSCDGDYLEDTVQVGPGRGHDNPNWDSDNDLPDHHVVDNTNSALHNQFLQEGNRAYEDSLRQSGGPGSSNHVVRLELVEEEQDDHHEMMPRIEGEVCEISSDIRGDDGAGSSDCH